MNLFNFDLVDGVSYRLGMQFVIFLAASLVTLTGWREYRRDPSPFLHFISLSFIVLFLQSAFMLGAFAWSVAVSKGLPEPIMPLVDHFFKVGGAILLAYAFAVVVPGLNFTKRYFLIANIVLLVLATSVVWLYWLQFLDTTGPGQGRFSHFWGDLAYETWVTLVFVSGFYFARQSQVAMKGAFLLALAILIARQLLHIGNIVVSHNQISWVLFVERLLILPFCGVIIAALLLEGHALNDRTGGSRKASHVASHSKGKGD